MSIQHRSPAELAQEAYRAGELTITIIEKIEAMLEKTPGAEWVDRTGLFMALLFTSVSYPNAKTVMQLSYPNVKAAMRMSEYTGQDHWDETKAPIGSVHWYSSPYGQAAIDMGPMGLVTVSSYADSRFAAGVGFIPRDGLHLPYLGWSLDYGGSDPLVSEQIVFRGAAS